MLRQEKVQCVEELRQRMAEAAVVLFIDFNRMTVAEANTLRRMYQKQGAQYRVIKNSLVTLAVSGTSYAQVSECLAGAPTGVVISKDDPVATAKAIFDFANTCEHIRVKGGIFEQRSLNPAAVEALSKLPSRVELLGTVIAQMRSVGGRLAAQIKAPAGRIVGAIDTWIKNKEEAAA
jgi:large subunit ribosomal protein L10